MTIPVKLYGYPNSPYVRRTYFCSLYKRVTFETVFVNVLTNAEIDFADRKMVPILQAGDEHRYESSDHAVWLDELFPDQPLLCGHDEAERSRIMKMNAWVDETLYSNFFRMLVDHGGQYWARYFGLLRSWKVLHETCGAPRWLMPLWPLLVGRAGFIRKHATASLARGSIHDAHSQTVNELADWIGGGPFMDGFEQPTLADLSAYAQITLNYLVDYHPREDFLGNQVIRAWFCRVRSALPQNEDMIPVHLRRALPI